MIARATEVSARAADMVRAGQNPAKVAKLLGLHVATVRRACHRAGVPLKPVGRPAKAHLAPCGQPVDNARIAEP